MKTVITRKIFALLLVAALCAALTQPILAYMGGELPELPPDEAADCATNGVCEVYGSGDEDFEGAAAVYSEDEDVSVELPEGFFLNGETLRIVHSDENSVRAQLLTASRSGVKLYKVYTLIIDAEAPLSDTDWGELFYLNEFLPDVENLTVNGLDHVIDDAFKCPGAWIINLSLPDVRTVGERAFLECDSLVTVSLPNVSSIGVYAFSGCVNLSELYFGDVIDLLSAEVVDPDGIPITVYHTQSDRNEPLSDGRITYVYIGGAGPADPDPADPDPADPNPADPGPADPANPAPDVPASEVSQPNTSSKSSSKQPDKPVSSGPAAVDTGELMQAVQSIAEAAASSGSDTDYGGGSVRKSIILRFENKSYISFRQLRKIAGKSRESGINVTVHADTKVGNTVVNRLYIDPSKATSGISLMTGKDATRVLRRFEKYTENTLAVLSLDQQGSFGMDVGMAFRLPLPEGTDVRKLAIYSFNPETGKYRRIFVSRKKVEPGYLWLKTDCAGFIVISEGPLKRRY